MINIHDSILGTQACDRDAWVCAEMLGGVEALRVGDRRVIVLPVSVDLQPCRLAPSIMQMCHVVVQLTGLGDGCSL